MLSQIATIIDNNQQETPSFTFWIHKTVRLVQELFPFQGHGDILLSYFLQVLLVYFSHLVFNPPRIDFHVYCKCELRFIFFPIWMSNWPSTIYWTDYSSLLSVTFILNQLAICVWVHFWTHDSFIVSLFAPNTTVS